MEKLIVPTIQTCENRLKNAMLSSDINELETLLSNDLIFTDHTGAIHSKDDDINAHKSGFVSIKEIQFSQQNISTFKDTAIVSVIMNITGIFGGNPATGKFRFTRIWMNTEQEQWQLIAGHSTLMPE